YDIDDSDALLRRDSFEDGLGRRRARDDQSALALRVLRVQHPDRDVLLHSGKDGRGVENFGAEVSEFCSLFKADYLDAMRIGADIGIGRQHAVDIGPYLDGVGVECGAKQSGGEVRTSAAD